MVGELGFEPRLTESESAVLPLDDSPLSHHSLWLTQSPYQDQVPSRAFITQFTS